MKFKKLTLILSIPAITMIAACGQEEIAYAPEITEDTSLAQEADDSTESAQEEQEAKEDIERQAEEQAEQEAQEEVIAQEEAKQQAEDQKHVQRYKEEALLQQLKESMIGVANIEFSQEDKIYYLYPTDPMMLEEIHNLVNYGYGMESWDYMVESLAGLSEAAQQVVGDGYRIMFMNPANTENVLIIIQDGQIIYDAMDDL